MRKFVLAFMLALTAAIAGSGPAAGGQPFDFGDMPPLPPPLLDDSPNPPPLSGPPAGGAMSPLVLPQPGSATRPPVAPPPAAPGSPRAPAVSVTPSAPPPLAPPPLVPPPADPVAPVALPGDVGAAPAAAQAAPAPQIPETPRPAKITGGRVNVRAGPNTQYESVAVLTTGAPITVLAKNGDWLKIVYPQDQLASIHKNFVDATITGEIPEAGVPGVVNQDNADVHAFYWDKSTVVGKLNKGDSVVIKQERGQWYRIAAPASARAYVFAEYVRVDGNEQVAADSAPPPTNPSVDLAQGQPDATGRLKLSENDRKAAALKEAYFKRIQDQYKREEAQTKESVNELTAGIDDLEAKLKAVDAETSSRMSYSATTTDLGSAAWAPPDPLYGGYTGWVENIGRVGGAPASFRLTKNGEIRYYLRSDRFSLNDFVGRRVWLNGNVEVASGATANVLNVDQIRILTDLEIAEGMRQYAESANQPQALGTAPQPYATPAQPYATTQYAAPSGAGALPQGYQLAPVVPSDPSMLPDVVGAGRSGGAVITGSPGEVDSDFFENPVISEIGP